MKSRVKWGITPVFNKKQSKKQEVNTPTIPQASKISDNNTNPYIFGKEYLDMDSSSVIPQDNLSYIYHYSNNDNYNKEV